MWGLFLINTIPFELNGWKTPNAYSNKWYGEPPNSPGLYVFVFCGSIQDFFDRKRQPNIALYVGMSKNLRNRLTAHPIAAKLRERFDYFQVYFKESDENLLGQEKSLIQKYNPPYNIQHRKLAPHALD